jgi:hypothetical protein
MKHADYVPRPDIEFDAWQIVLLAMIVSRATAWGIPADEVTALVASQALWTSAWGKASNTQTRSTADVREKDNAREIYERLLRAFVLQWLSYNKKVTDGERESMSLTVHTDERTPSPVPTTMPVITIDASIDQQHTVHFFDSAGSRKGKPAGVYGCEIWMKIGGTASESGEGFTFVAVDTNSPHVINFAVEDIGKTVYYRVRWINTRGQQGPWSKIVHAIVAG